MIKDNLSGKPLASAKWLDIHHYAKLKERTNYAKKLAELQVNTIVDLGCASGLWLELLNDYFPESCEFIGIDCDEDSLEIAYNKSKSWKRKTKFLRLDLESEANLIPASDLTLAFNVFPYIKDLERFVNILAARVPKGILAVRQYDGAAIRFGPLPTYQRQQIEIDLRTSLENSDKFNHYDLDRVIEVLNKSAYNKINFEFELFSKISPFDNDFIPYYIETLKWTYQNISFSARNYLKTLMCKSNKVSGKYFYEVDLVATLS